MYYLLGRDLNNNTYWEFRIAGTDSALRPRRIVVYPKSTHVADVKVPPLWHQWLRYTRLDPPSIEEQVAEVSRQARIRVLAAQADARWKAGGQVISQQQQQMNIGHLPSEADASVTTASQAMPVPDQPVKEDPWAALERSKKANEQWQPDSWKPQPSPKSP